LIRPNHRWEKNTEYPRIIATHSLGFHPLFIHVKGKRQVIAVLAVEALRVARG
jgi:hypothetical protein